MPAWELYCRTCTQWRAGDGGLVGLDYGAVLATAAVYGITVTPELFDGLRVLEADVLAEQREKMEEWQKQHRSKSS